MKSSSICDSVLFSEIKRNNTVQQHFTENSIIGQHTIFWHLSYLRENRYSCVEIRYAQLFKAAKIHVQIMSFACCLNTAFNLTKPFWDPICLNDVTREKVAALTDHLMLLFKKTLRASMTLWRRYGVRKFDADSRYSG